MLNEKDIRDLVKGYGPRVNEGRTIKQIILDGDIPRLSGCNIYEGKVSDCITGVYTKDGEPIRLMYRTNRISTHDQNRGAVPFKDQVLAYNHDFMLNLVKCTLGTSQFEVEGLNPTSTVIASENLFPVLFENVVRAYMAKSSTDTSLYQQWEKAKKEGLEEFLYAGHRFETGKLSPSCKLDHVYHTPSTKEKVDRTVSFDELIEMGIATREEFDIIKDSSLEAFMIVSNYVNEKGMVIADSKTEHGVNKKGLIVSMDELYTMDSSRFWKIDDNGNILLDEKGDPVSFSKEFARGMVKDKSTGEFSQEQTEEIAVRYIQGLQYLTGEEFKPDLRSRDERLIESTELILDRLM